MQRSPKALDHRWDIGSIYTHVSIWDLKRKESEPWVAIGIVASPCFSLPDAYQKVMQLEGVQGVHVSCRMTLIHLLNYIIYVYLQETHFWTLCSNYYCGGLKLEVAATADPKYVLL